MSSVFLNGIKISGYRSFNHELIFDDLSKINLIIGQNNSGKSNLLRFLSRHLGNLISKGVPFNDLDDRPRHGTNNLEIAFKIKSDSIPAKNLVEKEEKTEKLNRALFSSVKHIWVYFSRSGNAFQVTDSDVNKTLEHITNEEKSRWAFSLNNLTGKGHHEFLHWSKETIRNLNSAPKLAKPVDLIPALRGLKIFNSDGASIDQRGYVRRNGIGDHSGMHLIEELFKLQSPNVGDEFQRKRFDQINDFMKDVIGNDSLQLEIPHTRDSVIVNMDDKRLNINELGSGIEEILIIAAKSTMFSDQIVCIEEPELHLHPTLQRKLLRYLYEKTNNQYFIATHSAHLLDTVECAIYHMKLVNGYSQVVSALNDQDKFMACNDLGYKASDLLQSNFIIWVEGPSDRVYLKHWIKGVDDKLVEGLHYSIMFYGGRLLSHLTVDDFTVTEFIALQRLNQNMAIIIDSDRKKRGEKINSTKQRIRNEFESRGYLVWITEGREIENYLSPNLYKKTVKSIYGDKLKAYSDTAQYEDMTVYYSGTRKITKNIKNIDKIRLAHAVADEKADLSVMDLNKQINKLVEEINKANLLDV